MHCFICVDVCDRVQSASISEYTQPTSCSSNQFYQISNLSCVDCATNLVKANNGMNLYKIVLLVRIYWS